MNFNNLSKEGKFNTQAILKPIPCYPVRYSPLSTSSCSNSLKCIESKSPIDKIDPSYSANRIENDPIISKLDLIFQSIRPISRRNIRKQKTNQEKKIKERKSPEQMEILTKEITDTTEITKQRILELVIKTGLKKAQVYKWFWDHKIKIIA